MRLGVLLDLDGTLVDSVYHHVLAWDRALVAHGHHVPLDRIHRGIGLGGSRLVTWLLGGAPDDLDAITDAHEELFLEQRDRLRPTVGATAPLDDLDGRGVPTVIATSAQAAIRQALLAALGDPPLPAPTPTRRRRQAGGRPAARGEPADRGRARPRGAHR